MERRKSIAIGAALTGGGALVGGILGAVFFGNDTAGIPIGAAIGGAIGAVLVWVSTDRRGDAR